MAKGARKRRGKVSFRSKAKLPRYAGIRTQLQLEKNRLRTDETMGKFRYGFKMCWTYASAEMRRHKVGRVGSFDPTNSHGGQCWGWPKECKLTSRQARSIFRALYLSGKLTIDQLIVVRKSLAYAYELSGGVKPGGNYAGVKEVWRLVQPATCAPAKGRVLPQRVPTVEELAVFGIDWTPECGMSLIDYSSRYVMAHDTFLFGLRSTEDVERVKKSYEHNVDYNQGWIATSFVGGRAKLCGVKKGTREWKIWTTCFCNKKHQGPPDGFEHDIMKDGNPYDPSKVTWTTSCPISCLQLLWRLQKQPRRYGKWLPSGRFGTSNHPDPVSLGIDWMVAMGATTPENRYDRNAGRKSCARWTRRLALEYPPIFQMVGDLESAPNRIIIHKIVK